MQSQFKLEPFHPGRGLGNNHIQTILGKYARGSTAGIVFHRQRVETPDGDFFDLDFPEIAGLPLAEPAPIVLLLHGLEGHSRRGYMCQTYRLLARQGIRSVGMNFRSCSGEMNRQPWSYHAGATEDVALALDALERWYPNAAKGLVGFSLGANLTLKYLGERGEKVRPSLRAAVAVSPPFDLSQSVREMQKGLKRVYGRLFLNSLRQKMQAKAGLVQQVADLAQILAARSVYEFDNVWTAPVHGFQDADDYYAQCSAGRYLAGIRVPTLILRAIDDPMFAPQDIPYDAIRANPHLHAGITRRGGHLGYIEGRPGRFSGWAERQASRFMRQYLT